MICRGRSRWVLDETRDGPGDEHATSHDTVTVSVKFDEQDGEWVDAGSTYSWNGSSQFDTNPGNDDPHDGLLQRAPPQQYDDGRRRVRGLARLEHLGRRAAATPTRST